MYGVADAGAAHRRAARAGRAQPPPLRRGAHVLARACCSVWPSPGRCCTGRAVLLLDEPHSGLDPHAVDILDGLLAEIRAEHTFVMATHNLRQGPRAGRPGDDPRRRPRRPAADAAGSTAADFAAVYREHVREGSAGLGVGLRQFRAMLRKDIVSRAAHPRDGRLACSSSWCWPWSSSTTPSR